MHLRAGNVSIIIYIKFAANLHTEKTNAGTALFKFGA